MTFKYRNLVHGSKQTLSVQIQFIFLILTFVNHPVQNFLIGWCHQLLNPLLETRFLMSRSKGFQMNDSVGFTHDTQKCRCFRGKLKATSVQWSKRGYSVMSIFYEFSAIVTIILVITKNQVQRDFEIYSLFLNSRIFLLTKVAWRPKQVLLPKRKLIFKLLRRPP